MAPANRRVVKNAKAKTPRTVQSVFDQMMAALFDKSTKTEDYGLFFHGIGMGLAVVVPVFYWIYLYLLSPPVASAALWNAASLFVFGVVAVVVWMGVFSAFRSDDLTVEPFDFIVTDICAVASWFASKWLYSLVFA